MICLELSINGRLLCRSGIDNAILLSSHLSHFVGSGDGATLRVNGVVELAEGTDAHVLWQVRDGLSIGDVIGFTLVDAENPTEPYEALATDSPKYVNEQKAFEEFEKTFERTSEPAVKVHPAIGFRCSAEGVLLADAVLACHEEHLLCSVDWDCYKPQRARVFVRSFGRMAGQGEPLRTEWLRLSLRLNETLTIEMHG